MTEHVQGEEGADDGFIPTVTVRERELAEEEAEGRGTEGFQEEDDDGEEFPGAGGGGGGAVPLTTLSNPLPPFR